MQIDTKQINQWVEQTQNGDEVAFGLLYDEFAAKIYRYIRLKVSEDSIAEDLLQDVFMKAWKGCRSLPLDNLNFQAWLYKVASNTINDYYRKIYRQPTLVPIDEAIQIANQDNPAADAAGRFEKQVVRRAMEQLPAKFKKVIELRFFEDFSVSETARILNKNLITVRVWQHRAVKQLEKIYQQTKTARSKK